MIVKHAIRLPIDSDLTPFVFCRAHDTAGDFWWATRESPHYLGDFFSQSLIVSPETDLRVVRLIQEICGLGDREIPVTFADIPEDCWILFCDRGRIAVYSVGA